MTQPRRAFIILALLAGAAVITLSLSMFCGSSGCFAPSVQSDIVWQLRLPRVLSACAVGGLLALSGALMQVLLRNPLADPYVLGVSGGAATGAMGMMLIAPATLAALNTQWAIQMGAFAGALAAIALLFGLARGTLTHLKPAASPSGIRLILTGVMLASGFGAVMTLILSMAPDMQLRGMVFWLMGDLDNSQFYLPAWIALGIALAWAFTYASQLNVLAHGDTAAQLLGVPVVRLRTAALLVASLATACAVATAGTIGFVGLVVPHAMRLLIGNDQRILLPASALAGGAALTLADLFSRTIVAPVQLPVGVITALVGVPVFLVLLSRSRS
jgi:iron complex transport system permease protein